MRQSGENMPSAASFASVKLPGDLVNHAKDAAKPMRRSAAGQIEYWATLGRVVEAQGLSAAEAQSAIQAYENAISLDALTGKILGAQNSGSLAAHVRLLVKENQQRAKT
jgi:cytochrome c-type biogenesis protein CcmH/NrfG